MGGEPCCRSSALMGAFALAMCTGDSGQSSPQLPNYICAVSWLLVSALTGLSPGMLLTDKQHVWLFAQFA